jgi:hypothetical protein
VTIALNNFVLFRLLDKHFGHRLPSEAYKMGQLNWNRLILGGLLAGLIIDASEVVVNGVIFKDEWGAVMQSFHHSPTLSVKQMIVMNLWGFATGITMMWLYASIRPRYGAGPKTAVIAGAAMWLMNYALGSVFPVVAHIYPLRLATTTLLIGLLEAIVAAWLGAMIYQEAAQPLSRTAAA